MAHRRYDHAVAESVRAELRRLGLTYRGASLEDIIVEHRAQAAAALLTALRARRTTPIGDDELDVYGNT